MHSSFVQQYLQKHQFRPGITQAPHPDLQICIVIPCYNEPDLISSLQSIYNCTRPSCATEIIIVINSPESCDDSFNEQNLITRRSAEQWIDHHKDSSLSFHIMYRPDLPKKFAGVGLARKIGMDEAVHRLNHVYTKGIIAGFDADSTCDPNYLTELEKHFTEHPKTPGASIYFEHPVNSQEEQGIVLYELHLRYLNQSLRYSGHPHAYHTVGSSFAVTLEAYVKQGGMNKRQAGEDFYFIQKIIALGNYSEINTTRIIPSQRESDRVPFGTGASMKKWKTSQQIKTYPFELFENLKEFIVHVPDLYHADSVKVSSILQKLAPGLKEYLIQNNFQTELTIVQTNSASKAAFINRFFQWFNAFRVIKYLNQTNETENGLNVDITTEAGKFLRKTGFYSESLGSMDLLAIFRKLDKEGFGINLQQ